MAGWLGRGTSKSRFITTLATAETADIPTRAYVSRRPQVQSASPTANTTPQLVPSSETARNPSSKRGPKSSCTRMVGPGWKRLSGRGTAPPVWRITAPYAALTRRYFARTSS